MTDVASLDAMETFAELVVNLAWAALLALSLGVLAVALRSVIASVRRARITIRSTPRKS